MTMNRREEEDRLVGAQLAENIERRRAELRISQAECARRAEISISEIVVLEAGARLPLATTLKKVAAALDWEASDLLDGIRWVLPGEHDEGHIDRRRR